MRRVSDGAEQTGPAAGCAVRARKRKADVATFLQDPDEEIAKMEMTRKKQHEIQVTGWSLSDAAVISLSLVIDLQYLLVINHGVTDTATVCYEATGLLCHCHQGFSLLMHVQGDNQAAKVATGEHRPHSLVREPSWNNVHKNAHMLIPTPDKDDDPVGIDYSHFIHLSVVPTRASPLPVLGWANREDVWKNMINKEETYVRDKLYMQRHPLLQPKMRTILLDWLMEVCEVYKLHRETFYLAQDFFDRFMATQQNVVKTLLQLIGISSLFIAAKLEEIYPPKLHQFAYVTDGACTEDEILSMELIIMKALNWNLSPLTVVSWLNIYMQVAYLNELYEVLLPQYPQQIFVQIAELLDLCVLDVSCLEYTYGVLAASALYHFSSSELIQKVSGYEWCEIEECVKWMVPFAMALREVGSSKLKHFRGVAPEDLHNIQTHINSLDLLDKAQAKQAILAEQNRTSPFPSGVLTPPQSSKKQPSAPKQL